MNLREVESKRQKIIANLKNQGLTRLESGELIEDLPLMSLSILESQMKNINS